MFHAYLSPPEMLFRRIGFLIFRIHKKAFPTYIKRFGEDILSQAIFILYEKIKTLTEETIETRR